jgi:integrase
LCAGTIKLAHSILVQALGDAVRHNLVSRNVAREQRPPKAAADVEIQIVRKDEIGPMLAKLAGDQFHAPATVAIYTGLRRGELLALRWSNVDLEAKVLRVREALEETRKGGITIKAPKTSAGRRGDAS